MKTSLVGALGRTTGVTILQVTSPLSEKDVNNRNYAIAVRVLQCKRLFKSIYGAGKKEIVSQFKERLESAESRVKKVIYGS